MKRTYLFLLISSLIAPLSAFAEESIFVQVPALIDPAAPIAAKVKSECGVEMLLGNHTVSAMSKSGASIKSAATPEEAGLDQFVQLTILSAQGFGGGAWSGPKSITVRAELRQGGKAIDSTILTRATNGGAFAGFKGTCSMFERVTVALGKDVAAWVARSSTKAAPN